MSALWSRTSRSAPISRPRRGGPWTTCDPALSAEERRLVDAVDADLVAWATQLAASARRRGVEEAFGLGRPGSLATKWPGTTWNVGSETGCLPCGPSRRGVHRPSAVA